MHPDMQAIGKKHKFEKTGNKFKLSVKHALRLKRHFDTVFNNLAKTKR